MKKVLMVILVMVLSLSLSACGKSEAATAVDDKIMAIGEVTLNSKDALDEIDAAIEALEEKDKGQLEYLEMFETAKAEYVDLLIKDAEKHIDAIGKVTLKSGDKIKTAQKHYDLLTKEQKEEVKNRTEFKEAKETYNQLHADKVKSLIKDIGEVTLDKKKAIEKAEDAYDKLTSAQKEKVTNYDVLKSARKRYNQLKKDKEKQEGIAALGTFSKEYDKVEQITWYDCFPRYIDTRCYVLPYIGERNGNVWMNIRYNYTGDSWDILEKVILVVDGEKYTKTPDYYEIIHDNDTEVWEYVDLEADIDMMKKIASSKETIVRFQGDDYHHDFTISAADKKIMKNALKAYEYLKNK